MAWQSGPGSNGVGGMAMGDSNGVQAYTLQGVMRFLQTEWHRHERDRNSWEIEREEMKKRIAHLEGEARSSKGLRGILERQIRMLEFALKKERETINRIKMGEPVEISKDPKEAARKELDELKDSGKISIQKNISHLDAEIDPENHLAQEITYRVLPGTHIPPDANDPIPANYILSGQQPTQRELQDAYIQLQAIKQQQHKNNVAIARENALQPQQPGLSTYPDQTPLPRSNNQVNHSQVVVRELDRKLPEQPIVPLTSLEGRRAGYNEAHVATAEQVEAVSHSYDAYGRQVAPKEVAEMATATDDVRDAADGWDFDDPPPPIPADALPSHRPDTENFPNATSLAPKSPPRAPGSYRRKSSGARRRSEGGSEIGSTTGSLKADAMQFKVRFAMRGHLDVVRSVIFTGGGSPAEPEFCTAGDDGTVKRWHIPASYAGNAALTEDLDRIAHFTHRGHAGPVCSLAACPASPNFSNGGRVAGDGWIFSGGEDASVKVWERGRVDPKASLEGHTDAVWALCVLPGTSGSILGDRCSQHGGPDRILLAAGASDGTILIWAVSAPPQLSSPHAGSNRGARGSRRANSISAGSNFPSSPQPSVASNTPFKYSLVHRIEREGSPSPTSICSLNSNGESFVVSYTDASVLVFDTRTGEEVVGMASQETYDGTPDTAVNAVTAKATGFEGVPSPGRRSSLGEDEVVHGATGSEEGIEGMIIAGYEDRYIRLFDANSGQCTYTMLAHPSAISSLSLSPDGRELVSGGHDASLRFWSLEKRNCTQEITSHRIMRGEGVCAVAWSPDGRWVISCGGDGAVKVFSRG